MSQENNNELAYRTALCEQINYDLLVRTVVRLSPDVAKEIAESAQEFLRANEQVNPEVNEFFNQTVELVTNVLVDRIKNEMPNNQKESTHE